MNQTKKNQNEDKFIKLIKKEQSTQRINTRKRQQKEVQNEQRKNSKEFLHLNLNTWKFLANGGAFWIFYIPKQNLSLSSKSNKITYKYEQNGDYVLRIRQIKWIKRLIDIRIEIILQSLIKDSEQIKVKVKETLSENTSNQVKNKQDNLTKLQDLENQLVKEQKRLVGFEIKENNDRLTIILRAIYDQFLTNTINNPLQQTIGQNKSHHHKVNNRTQLLPQISKALVRQSQSFEIDHFNQQDIDNFVQFLFKEVMIQKLQSKIKKQKLNELTNDEITQRVNENLQKYLINYEILKQIYEKQQVCITFQRNLLNLSSIGHQKKVKQQKENNINVQKQSFSQENNLFQVHIGQVFELKPKTILPDIYTEQFIDEFVHRYKNHQCIKQLVKMKQQQRSDNLLLRQPLSQIVLTKQKIKQAVIQEIQSTIIEKSNLTTKKLLIESTRWFKKNCLQKGKRKKNQNPFIYFINCINRNNVNFKTENVNYYDKKHIRKVQVMKIVDYKNKIKDKKVKRRVNENKNEPQNENELQQGNLNPLNNKDLSSLHNQIINHINLKQQLTQNYHTTKSIQQNKQQNQNLSLIEEILALQLIDLVNVDTFLQNNHIQINQATQLNYHNYISVMKVQDISHVLKYFTLKNNQFQSFSNLHLNDQQSNGRLINPSIMSLKFINNYFHPQVYCKSLKLAQQLKYIIFQSPQINQVIQKTFNLAQIQLNSINTQKPTDNKMSSKTTTIIDSIKLQIKTDLFYLIRYLISLTWKDISLLIQQQLILNLNNNNQNIQSFVSKSQQPSLSKSQQRFSQFSHLNQIQMQKQQLNLLISKSILIQRKILNSNIIDYNLKTLQNIDKNVEKDHQFLLNFLKYRLKNNKI